MGKIAKLYLDWGERCDEELDYVNCSLEAEAIIKRQLKEFENEIIELIKREVIPIDNPPLCNEAVIDECLKNLEKLKEK